MLFTLLFSFISMAATDSANPEEAPLTVDSIIEASQLSPIQVSENNSAWYSLSADLHPMSLKQFGLSGEIGHQTRFFGVDFRASLGTTTYKNIFVEPDYTYKYLATDASSATNPDSQLNRPRTLEDRWSYALLEPGISISRRLFIRSFPRWTQKARVGAALARLIDTKSRTPFNGYFLSTELSTSYQLSKLDKHSIFVSVCFRSGALVAKGPEDGNHSRFRLPANWFTLGLGLARWF